VFVGKSFDFHETFISYFEINYVTFLVINPCFLYWKIYLKWKYISVSDIDFLLSLRETKIKFLHNIDDHNTASNLYLEDKI